MPAVDDVGRPWKAREILREGLLAPDLWKSQLGPGLVARSVSLDHRIGQGEEGSVLWLLGVPRLLELSVLDTNQVLCFLSRQVRDLLIPSILPAVIALLCAHERDDRVVDDGDDLHLLLDFVSPCVLERERVLIRHWAATLVLQLFISWS